MMICGVAPAEAGEFRSVGEVSKALHRYTTLWTTAKRAETGDSAPGMQKIHAPGGKGDGDQNVCAWGSISVASNLNLSGK